MTSISPMTSQIRATTSPRIRRLALALSLVAIASFGCAKEQDSKEQHLSRANDYFAAEQYDKAEKEYRDVLRLAPEDPAALRQLGIIYLDQGQILQAYPLLKKSSELQPDDPEIQLKLGLTFLALGALCASARRRHAGPGETAGATNRHFCCWSMLHERPTTLRTPENSFRASGKKIRTAPVIIWHWERLICGKTTRRARKANSKPLLIWTRNRAKPMRL